MDGARPFNILSVFQVDALHSSQQFFSNLETFFLGEPVLSSEDKVSCLKTYIFSAFKCGLLYEIILSLFLADQRLVLMSE